jgi:hypothetical protein
MHRKLEKMKMELMEKHEVEFGELYFSLIPTTSVQEFLTDKNLKTFLKKQKTPFIEEDITAILRWMNRDFIHPTSASLSQYVKTMIPLHIPKQPTEKWILAMCKGRIEIKMMEKVDQNILETKQ